MQSKNLMTFYATIATVSSMLVVGCERRGADATSPPSGQSRAQDAKQLDAASVVQAFWSSSGATTCDESLERLTDDLAKAEPSAIRRLEYQFIDDAQDKISFRGVAVEPLTGRLRSVETALATCSALASPESKVQLLLRVDDVLAGAMLSLRRDLGVEPGEGQVPSSYRAVAAGRLWVHGQLLQVLAEGSSERASVVGRLDAIKEVTKNPDRRHEVP